VPWDRIGGRSVSWVGGVLTVLGVVLLLVLAVRRDLIGPAPRLLCGVALAAALLTAAARVHRGATGRAGAFALAATGFAVLFLDAVAATVLYGFLSPAAGLCGGLVVAAAGLLLADRWDSLGLAVFVVLAAAASAPVVTAGVTPVLVDFLLVLAAAAAPVQLRRDWPHLAVASAGPPLLAVLALDGLAEAGRADRPDTAVVALVSAAGFLALAVGTVVRRPADPVAPALVLAAPIPVMAAVPLMSTAVAVASLAAVSALLFGVWVVHRTWDAFPARFAAVAGGAGALALGQATVVGTLGHGPALPLSLLCQAALLALVARLVSGRGTWLVAAAYLAGGIGVAMAGPVPWSLLLHAPSGPPAVAALVDGAVVGAAILAAALTHALAAGSRSPWVWAGLGLGALYGFAGAVLSVALLLAPDATGFRVGHVVITVGWAACALGLLVKGVDTVVARRIGLALAGAAVLKLMLFDLERLDGLVRVSVCIGVGVVLLGAGSRYAKLVAAAREDGDAS
jgi:hypothetical protein